MGKTILLVFFVDITCLHVPPSKRYLCLIACTYVCGIGKSAGIPYGTVNLKYGVPRDETTESSLAGAGTLTVEFSVLSALTGDGRFAEVRGTAVSGGDSSLFLFFYPV